MEAKLESFGSVLIGGVMYIAEVDHLKLNIFARRFGKVVPDKFPDHDRDIILAADLLRFLYQFRTRHLQRIEVFNYDPLQIGSQHLN